MRVGELIKLLQNIDPMRFVYVDGYEGGLVELQPEYVEQLMVKQNVWLGVETYGPHDRVRDLNESGVFFHGVLFNRVLMEDTK